jgi:hypothetical protein
MKKIDLYSGRGNSRCQTNALELANISDVYTGTRPRGIPMRILIAAFVLSLSQPLAAEPAIVYPVSIPQECVQLAEREHVSVLIANRYQALKAEYKLSRLSRADPMVAQCKDAVVRLKAASKS